MTRITRKVPALKSGPVSLSERIPPHLYFVGSAIFHYLGPSFAVLLFARVSVSGVTWLRIVSAGLVFALWRKPWRAFAATNGETRGLIAALGAVFAVMNYSFYIAIDRLPLGTVAAIEFIGPILLALLGARSWRNLSALVLAAVGVYLLTDIRFAGEPIGFAWAFANAALFTLYIVPAHRISRSDPHTKPIDRLGAAMLVATVVIIPLGIIVLKQIPTWLEVAGIGLVIGGVLIHREPTFASRDVPVVTPTTLHATRGNE